VTFAIFIYPLGVDFMLREGGDHDLARHVCLVYRKVKNASFQLANMIDGNVQLAG